VLSRTVAVDLDGVLADTMTACCRMINMAHSTHLQVSSFVHWKAWEIANITKDEFFRDLDEAWFHWQMIPPTETRLAEKIQKLLEIAKVDIVTGRSSKTVTPAKAWLRQHGIQYNSFVRTDSGMDKLRLSYAIFIDDSPELMEAISSTTDRRGILYTQPWNKELAINSRIFRVDSWNQIPKIVAEILRIDGQT